MSLVSIADSVFGLSCFSIDILWKNLSCPELLFSPFLCLSVVLVDVVIILLCVFVCENALIHSYGCVCLCERNN